MEYQLRDIGPKPEKQRKERWRLLGEMRELRRRYLHLESWHDREIDSEERKQEIEDTVLASQAIFLLDDAELKSELEETGLGDWIKQCKGNAIKRQGKSIAAREEKYIRFPDEEAPQANVLSN